MSNIINFGAGMLPIYLDYKSAKLYHHCKRYDPSALAQPGNWHLIKINHKGLLEDAQSQYNKIIEALFDAVEDEEFYPVSYRKGDDVDSFLVRNCQGAIDKLFSRNLLLEIEYGSPPLELAIYFNIANYKFGQISPQNLMSRVLFNLFDNLVHYNGIDDLLNLNYFSEQVEFTHTIIYLGNTAVLKKLCELINNNDRYRDINGILMAGNNIGSVFPLQILDCSSFKLLDLSKNSISSIKRFCREMKEVCVHEIRLAGNPIVKSSKYPKCLIEKGLEKNFKYVDGIAFDKLLSTYTHTSVEMDLSKHGKLINEKNVAEIRSYAQSDDWHAISVPDPAGLLSKECLIDYFFLLVSPDLSEFYPCYYKYDNVQHSFLVRQCFDQLMYIAETSNFALLIPHMVEGTDGDGGEGQCILDKGYGVQFNFHMGVRRFLDGQVEPRRDLQKAIAKRYNVVNRVLDLNNLQSSDLLDNVTVKMSSCKILMTILNIAGRMFLDNCTELRLSENKILNIGKLSSLGYFAKLLAIDLSNNWISSLHDISELSVVPFKVMILDGNPLCKQYKVPSEYIKAVKDIFPHLNKLDNVDIQKNPTLVFHKNFLINPSGYEFADQFVRSYFPIYEESTKRFDLINVYASDAIFSMSCRYWKPRMKPELCRSVSKYTQVSRNICVNSHSVKGYYVGDNGIVPLLLTLPDVKHDFHSFTIDMPYYDLKDDGKNGSCAIYVSGLFKQSETGFEEDILYAFNRRFIIKFGEQKEGLCGDGRHYQIVNEHFSITTPTQNQEMTAFKYSEATPVLISSDSIKATPQDHETLLVLFKETTGLNAVWSNRCLEGSNWNYQDALKNFIKMTESNQIPKNAWDFGKPVN